MGRDVGVGQLVEELEQRGDRLPFEIGAFVALEACEGLLQQSVKLAADDVRVTAEGSVLVAGSAERAEPDEAARSLVSVLGRLLVAAGPGVPPYLLQLVNDSATGQTPRDLRHLHDAIEASLIPINRGASRRVLARLVRESDRPPAPEVGQVDARELDAELDELLRDPASRSLETSPVEALRAEVPSQEPEGPITERIRMPRQEIEETEPDTLHDGEPDGAAAGTTDADTAVASFPPPEPDLDIQPETVRVPSSKPALQSASVPVPDLKAPPAVSPVAAVVLTPDQPGPEPITATIRKWQPPAETSATPETETRDEAAAVSVSASVPLRESVPEDPSPLETATESVFGTGSVTQAESIPAPPPPTESMPAAAPSYDRQSLPEPPPARRGGALGAWLLAVALGVGAYALVASGALDAWLRPARPAAPVAATSPSGVIQVGVTPSGAQVFVFVGRGPAMASDLTVGGAHEFIVFDSGLRPSRAVVDAGAIWTTSDEGSLYELAVQATPAATPAETLDLGSPRTTPSTATDGKSGTIRVLTNPHGAKVYRYIGVGPSVQISATSIHEGQEILVYHPSHETRRVVIGPSDWQPGEAGQAHKASLEVELPALEVSAVPEPIEN